MLNLIFNLVQYKLIILMVNLHLNFEFECSFAYYSSCIYIHKVNVERNGIIIFMTINVVPLIGLDY